MAPGGGFSYLVGPTAAFIVIGLLALLLRWAFARGGSLVERPAQRGRPEDYGLLVTVATPDNPGLAEDMHARLESAGLRSTVVATESDVRVMVFPTDLEQARAELNRTNPDRSDPGPARE